MIDPEKLERQRQELERARLEARTLLVQARIQRARNALREAQLQAVRLGIRRECSNGCGRELHVTSQSGVCVRCSKTVWEREKRSGLRAVNGREG